MKKNIFRFLPIVLMMPLFSSCSFNEYWKKAVLSKLPFVRATVQNEFKTYTSITDIKDEMKLVTGKQQLDFINIMDGKDGRYLEISTYEVKAGIDCAKIKTSLDSDGNKTSELPSVEIFSSKKINSVLARNEAVNNNLDFYENYLKPVNIAYEEKSKDYSVELGLLKKAKEKAEVTLKNITGAELDIKFDAYKQTIDLPHLPMKIEIASDYLASKNILIKEMPENQFNRDSLVFESNGNDKWSIRIGDSGQRFDGKFSEFYKNVFETNTNKNNAEKDSVEIFRYFDPMYPKESEILSYASDSFRTFFLLNNGRVYYVDAVYQNEQTLLDSISPSMVYLASSVRKIQDKKEDYLDEYESYIDTYFDVQNHLRTNSDRYSVKVDVERLVNSNKIRSGEELTSEEKYLQSVSDVKNLGRNASQKTVIKTGDNDYDDITTLISELKISPDDFSDAEIREKALETASILTKKIQKTDYINLALNQYLMTWFLQNSVRFTLTDDLRKQYENDLRSGQTYIASRPLIATLTDSARNDYFYELFRNRLSMSHRYVDTAGKIDDCMKKSVRGNNMFVYFGLPESISDGEVYERMLWLNNGHEIENSFILVFNQKEFDFDLTTNMPLAGENELKIEDNDYHAFVLDDATLRLFLDVGSRNLGEKMSEVMKEFVEDKARKLARTKFAQKVAEWINPKYEGIVKDFANDDGAPDFFFYGDWKKLHVTPENVSVAGHNFATTRFTKAGKSEYRNSNDFAEKSVIAKVIDDLQHAYSSNDADYYYNTLCESLEYQIQHYVYEKMFRPSPRMILDMTKDNKYRYNY